MNEIGTLGDYCTIDGPKDNAVNDDELVIKCTSETLKKLGYSFNSSFTYKVEGLESAKEYPFEEPNGDTPNEPGDNTSDETEIPDDMEGSSGSSDAIEGAYISEDQGHLYFIDAKNVDKLDVSDIDKPIYMYVEESDFDKAVQLAQNTNIEWIQVKEKVYYKESGFKNWKPFMGAGGQND